MNRKRIIMLVVVLLLLGVTKAGAEEMFGVEVYGGAEYDAATSKKVSESLSINTACYRTNDSVAKVAEFYKKQPGMEYMGGAEESAWFSSGNIDVTIQNPWMDLATGEMMNDTLISIVKKQ